MIIIISLYHNEYIHLYNFLISDIVDSIMFQFQGVVSLSLSVTK